jgi:hypothetical protein
MPCGLNTEGVFPYRPGVLIALPAWAASCQESRSTMPPTKQQPAPEPEPLPVPSYPAIESFIETATAEEIQGLFAPIKDGLTALKGPKVEQGKKVQAALASAEELLGILLETRERLIAESKGGKGKR